MFVLLISIYSDIPHNQFLKADLFQILVVNLCLYCCSCSVQNVWLRYYLTFQVYSLSEVTNGVYATLVISPDHIYTIF